MAARCDHCKKLKRRCTAVEKPWAPCQRCVERKLHCLFSGQPRHHGQSRLVPTDPALTNLGVRPTPQATMLEQIQTPLTPKSSYSNYQEYQPQTHHSTTTTNNSASGITVELLPESPPPPPPSLHHQLMVAYPSPPKSPLEMYRHINEYFQMAGIGDSDIRRYKRQLMEMLSQDCSTAEHLLVELIKDPSTPIHTIEAACDQITTKPLAEWERVFYKELVAIVSRRNDDKLTRVYMLFLRRWPQPYYAHRDMVQLRVHAAVPESIVYCE